VVLHKEKALHPPSVRDPEDYAPFSRVILRGELNKEKALAMLTHGSGFFIVRSLQKQAFNGSPIKNPVVFATGLFLCSGE